MEFFLQQEGSLGTILLLAALLVGLLYLLLPVFIWRIWFWSHQNSKHLQELNTKLELLIRDIAPDALPPIEVPEEPKDEATTSEETEAEGLATGDESLADEGQTSEEDFFSEETFAGDLSDDNSMDFSMSDEFDDVSDDITNSEISDFTEEETSDDAGDDFSDGTSAEKTAASEEGSEDSDDELVMDFDDEGEDDGFAAESDDVFSETDDEPAPESETSDNEHSDFIFSKADNEPPVEIPITETDSSDFTVEHFDSNEEKSYEFEDVDDDSFDGPSDTFDDDELMTEETAADSEQEEAASTDDIWGEESAVKSGGETPAAQEDDDFSFGDEGDLGSAFDEPATAEKEDVRNVADSFLSDLENKLNLDSLSQQPATAPEAPVAPQPDPTPAAPAPKEEPAESQATLFARCEGCGHKLAYKQALSGKRVRCPACRTAFALP